MAVHARTVFARGSYQAQSRDALLARRQVDIGTQPRTNGTIGAGAVKCSTMRTKRALQLGPVCQLCRFSTAASITRRPQTAAILLAQTSNNIRTRQWTQKWPLAAYRSPTISKRYASSGRSSPASLVLKDVVEAYRSIRDSNEVPSDEKVVKLLRECQQIIESFEVLKEEHAKAKSNVTSSLLNLEENALSAERASKVLTTERQVADSISNLVNELLLDEKVFISQEALELYTKIQSRLKRADYFPKIFTLYANKPIPEKNTSPIKYRAQNPKSIKNAVPTELANMALDVAVEQKNLSLALAIIDTTFCAPAFYRAKIFKKASLPLAGLAAAPLASYVAASWLADYQSSMDHSTAMWIAFTGTLAYIGFTSSLGLIAVFTSNDQMERVTWASGIPLRKRWLREEERAALDKIAVAWGFKDPYRRGEEEGEEWENLREFIMMRGMILDKTELMEGME